MSTPRADKLNRITDEVREFHPLLKQLLPKLPNVKEVEYTHGNTEMGADFVLSQTDPTFDNIEYVGVVVKVGRIVQDFVDIERQIDECDLPRFFMNGKERIRVSEVWVIANQTISGGAQAKIHEKYKSRKIRFIDGARLQKLIDTYLPVFWTDVSLEVGEYLATAKTRNEQVDRSLSLIQIGDKGLYIESDLYEFPRLEYRQQMQRHHRARNKINLHDRLQKHDIILIEGGMGSGKSKLLRTLVDYYAAPDQYNETNFLPIPVTYRDLVDEYCVDISKLIEARLSSDLRAALKEPKYLLLIDAVDEKNLDVDEQVDALTKLVTCIKQTPGAKAIITSRYLRGLDRTNVLEREVERYELAPLSMTKTIEFIRALCTKLNITSRLIEDLKKSSLFRELPKSPIAAILLAGLLNENPKELPSNLTELYSQYLELMLGRWDKEKGLQSLREYQALDSIMAEFAKQFLEYELPQITISDAKEIVKAYLSERNLDIDPEDLFDKMTSRCEIVTADTHDNTFQFKHRTFAEFYYAKAYRNIGYPQLQERAFRFYWMNSVFFYLGLLKDCPEIIKNLAHTAVDGEGGRWLKVINMSNYMLAAYASPYKVIVESMTQTMVESAHLFNDIVAGTYSSSPFGSLSHMHVLYIMQILVRTSYSYEFFKAAIEESALQIEEGPYDDDIKAYALFFLNVAYIELGAKESFDFLLKKHSHNLPIDISLAIQHEAEDLKVRTDLMRKQDRRIRHLLQGNQSLEKQVERLYKQPIHQISSPKKQR